MIALLLAGLLGSLHCVGMCGGFVLALSLPGRARWRAVLVQTEFLLGKASTYVLLGGLVGLLGAGFVRAGWFAPAQGVLAVVAGGLMVLAGLQIAGLWGELPIASWFGPASPWRRSLDAVASSRHLAAPFSAGALVGFLPCPLVYAFLAAALASGGVLPAMATMAILGLASVPALALVAGVGALVSPRTRHAFVRVSGAVVALAGAVTVLRGVAPEALHAVFGHPAVPIAG